MIDCTNKTVTNPFFQEFLLFKLAGESELSQCCDALGDGFVCFPRVTVKVESSVNNFFVEWDCNNSTKKAYVTPSASNLPSGTRLRSNLYVESPKEVSSIERCLTASEIPLAVKKN